MKALLDTCIIIDALQNRAPFSEAAQTLFLYAANNQFVGCITAKSSTDIYYLMHHYTHDDKISRSVLSKLFSLFTLLDTTAVDCQGAVPSSVSDFEDAVMIETANRTEVDCIITRNAKDYEKSGLPVYAPEEFIAILASNND